ncbi:MAG TPA: phosphotransferase [Acidimicrobiia bacterium]|nr:phosphotransferase [Acidimicrobiia bacterium]
MIDGPHDITPDWLTTALRATTPDAHVRAVEVEQIGTGQTGASFRLHLDAEAGPGGVLPSTLVAKTAAGEREQRERVGPGYRNEVGFYTEFRDRVSIRTPRCWFAEISDDNCSFVLLLDDLAPARPGVQVDGCTVDQAADAIRNLAGLHAPLWNDPALPGRGDWLTTMTGPRAEFLGTVTQSAATVFIERYADQLGEDADTLRRSAELTARWGTIDTGVLTLVHGDYRLDNLMFPEEGDGANGGVVAVDWQTLVVAPPGRDLGYFLATSLHVDDRRAHQDALVGEYVDEIHRLGVVDFTVEQCNVEYRLGVLQAPMITMLGAAYATAERSTSADAMFLAMATRASAALRDVDSFALVEAS